MYEKELFDYLIINDKMDEFLGIEEDDEEAENPENNKTRNIPDSNEAEEREEQKIEKEQECDL